MYCKEFGSNRNFITLLLGCLVYGSVLLVNDGFMALDEYFVGITRYIPAQTSSVMSLVAPDDVKSPLQLLPMHGLAQAALGLGVESPYWQYRFVLFVLGTLSITLLLFAFLKFSKFAELKTNEEKLLLFMLIFYFGAPFALTRPMFESIAAPWLTIAAVYAFAYDRFRRLGDLSVAVTAASIAFVLRQQLGSCALICVLLPLLHKQWKHFFAAGLLGVFFFILAGIPDYFIRGSFHFSLLNLFVYNYQHGAEYGQQGIWYYPALIFVICLIPFFIKKYPGGFFKDLWTRYRSLYIILFLFVFLHSLFPNKWERFLISVIPLLVLIMFPVLSYLQNRFQQHKVRLISLYAFNFLLFMVASFFPAQKNLIEMSRYLDRHPEIMKVYRVADTPGWITEAFILNKKFEFIASDLQDAQSQNWADCSNALVVGEAQADMMKPLTDKLYLQSVFKVNLIEQLAFKLNPQKNLRRVQLKIFTGCQKSI
jgi:hypothetical protein